jgi:two-component system, LuxR family, response regulator FixJ
MHDNSQPTSPGSLVLVIDDDPAVLSSLKFSLEVEGFAVRAFHSGEELLDGRPPPDAACLVVDYKLEAMDGLSLVAELRRRSIDVPAILIASDPPASVRRRAAEAGLEIVEKPLLGDSLIEAIRTALHGDTPSP